jgi:hypothetical protein
MLTLMFPQNTWFWPLYFIIWKSNFLKIYNSECLEYVVLVHCSLPIPIPLSA